MEDPTIAKLPFASTPEPLRNGKIGRPRQRRGMQRRKAPPLAGSRVYGPQTPVSLRVVPRIGSELWLEVHVGEAWFYVLHDCSLLALIQTIQQGGQWMWYRS